MVDFNSVYQGDAPWDIGRPQKEFVQLEKAGEIVGSVLDVGSGTGENALFLAAQGHEVWGVDFSPNAIKKARDKATERNLNVTFLARDVLDLSALGRTFETIIDSGLFHVLSAKNVPPLLNQSCERSLPLRNLLHALFQRTRTWLIRSAAGYAG